MFYVVNGVDKEMHLLLSLTPHPENTLNYGNNFMHKSLNLVDVNLLAP